MNTDPKVRKANLESFVYNGDLHKKFLHNPRAVPTSSKSHFVKVDAD